MMFRVIINCTQHDTAEADEGWLFAIPRSGDLVDTVQACWRVEEVNWFCEPSETERRFPDEPLSVMLNCTLESFTGSSEDRKKFCCTTWKA